MSARWAAARIARSAGPQGTGDRTDILSVQPDEGGPMTSPSCEPGASEEGPDEGHTPRHECDPDLLDELKCRAKGIEAEAEYNALTMDELTQARTQYETARTEYNKVRKAATPDIREFGEHLTQVVDELKC